jgi:small subunit ribosomal protein S9
MFLLRSSRRLPAAVRQYKVPINSLPLMVTGQARFPFSTMESDASSSSSLTEDQEIETPSSSMQIKSEWIGRPPNLDEFGRAYGTGRRKSSVARVWIKEGSGLFEVNNKLLCDTLQPLQREEVIKPFLVTGTCGMFDVWCTVKGGGISGQSGAIRLGVSRALQEYQSSLRPALKAHGFITRDSRVVERKKPGQKKARKKFQWVKR